MTPADGAYEASFGPHPWGQRFVGHEEIRAALQGMGPGKPAGSRHVYGETHVVGTCACAFALWTNVHQGPTGPETTMHGADFYSRLPTGWWRPRSPIATGASSSQPAAI
jgi:hypothetical protein